MSNNVPTVVAGITIRGRNRTMADNVSTVVAGVTIRRRNRAMREQLQAASISDGA